MLILSSICAAAAWRASKFLLAGGGARRTTVGPLDNSGGSALWLSSGASNGYEAKEAEGSAADGSAGGAWCSSWAACACSKVSRAGPSTMWLRCSQWYPVGVFLALTSVGFGEAASLLFAVFVLAVLPDLVEVLLELEAVGLKLVGLCGAGGVVFSRGGRGRSR